MSQINQTGEIFSLTVHDAPKKASILFLPNTGGSVELKLTDDSDSSYDAMVSAATLAIARGLGGVQNASVKYDSGDKELDEITVR